VSKRISPARGLQAEIDEVLAGGEDLAGAIEQVAVLGARLLLQAAIEAEVTAYLGRDRYERAASCDDARAGMRNGYCPTTVKTTAGPVTLARPKVRGTTERFASQLFGKGVTKINALESLVIAGFVRGLSTRRCGGDAGGGARRSRGGVEIDGVAGVLGHQHPVNQRL
jgi:putative transposase